MMSQMGERYIFHVWRHLKLKPRLQRERARQARRQTLNWWVPDSAKTDVLKQSVGQLQHARTALIKTKHTPPMALCEDSAVCSAQHGRIIRIDFPGSSLEDSILQTSEVWEERLTERRGRWKLRQELLTGSEELKRFALRLFSPSWWRRTTPIPFLSSLLKIMLAQFHLIFIDHLPCLLRAYSSKRSWTAVIHPCKALRLARPLFGQSCKTMGFRNPWTQTHARTKKEHEGFMGKIEERRRLF